MKKKLDKLIYNLITERIILSVIVLNIVILIIATDENILASYGRYFKSVEILIISIFTVEYALRLITLKSFKEVFKPLMLIDLLAIAPFYLKFMTINTSFLRVARFIKVFQILKLVRYSKALQNIGNVFQNKKDELAITGLFFTIALILSSCLIYFAECDINSNLSSIPKALWWSIITFTSVGYGDVTPISPMGKFIASFVAILGVGLHGLLIGILGSGFVEQIQKKRIIEYEENLPS